MVLKKQCTSFQDAPQVNMKGTTLNSTLDAFFSSLTLCPSNKLCSTRTGEETTITNLNSLPNEIMTISVMVILRWGKRNEAMMSMGFIYPF